MCGNPKLNAACRRRDRASASDAARGRRRGVTTSQCVAPRRVQGCRSMQGASRCYHMRALRTQLNRHTWQPQRHVRVIAHGDDECRVAATRARARRTVMPHALRAMRLERRLQCQLQCGRWRDNDHVHERGVPYLTAAVLRGTEARHRHAGCDAAPPLPPARRHTLPAELVRRVNHHG